MNYIFTYCSGYDKEVFNNFISSFRSTHEKGTELIVFCQKKDIKKHLFQSEDRVKFKIVEPKFHPQTYRYFSYADFLATLNREEVGRILLCDSRDFLFQRDVFGSGLPPRRYPEEPDIDLYFTLECGFIHECEINRRWIEGFMRDIGDLNNDRFNRIARQRLSCSGATLGNFSGIFYYLDVMKSFISLSAKAKEGKEFRDQCIHNYIKESKLNGAPIRIGDLDHRDGLIHHVSWGYPRKTTFIKNGLVVNQLGNVAAGIHLYDRNFDFFSKFKCLSMCKNYELKFYKKII